MERHLYHIERSKVETVLCIGILAVLLYKTSQLPGAGSAPPVGAALARGQMIACRRLARWFGQQAMLAELRYRKAVN